MPSTKKTLALIDAALEKNQESSFRRHLGASIIGHNCARYLWYQFRWCKETKHPAKTLRIFDRGKLEEARFIKWFRDAGIFIQEIDQETGRQFSISACSGHFGGSCDGVGKGLPDLPAQWFIVEFKTHGEKSFKKLVVEKVQKANPSHYSQMQVYMRKLNVKWCLYCAVCKNTDDIYLELVALKKEVGDALIERASRIIFSDEPPPRLNSNPRWYECLNCSCHKLCHGFELPEKNCRTCAHSTPLDYHTDLGEWSCQLGRSEIAVAATHRAGCSEHIINPLILNGVTIGDGNLEENYVTLTLASGESIKYGPLYTTTDELRKLYEKKDER